MGIIKHYTKIWIFFTLLLSFTFAAFADVLPPRTVTASTPDFTIPIYPNYENKFEQTIVMQFIDNPSDHIYAYVSYTNPHFAKEINSITLPSSFGKIHIPRATVKIIHILQAPEEETDFLAVKYVNNANPDHKKTINIVHIRLVRKYYT